MQRHLPGKSSRSAQDSYHRPHQCHHAAHPKVHRAQRHQRQADRMCHYGSSTYLLILMYVQGLNSLQRNVAERPLATTKKDRPHRRSLRQARLRRCKICDKTSASELRHMRPAADKDLPVFHFRTRVRTFSPHRHDPRVARSLALSSKVLALLARRLVHTHRVR